MKKVVLFPGQGAQYKGMGKALFSIFREETQLASDILGYDLEELCVADPNKLLSKTEYTQPALYVVNHFLFQNLKSSPDYFVGHSLGEYNALLAAGAFSFETGLRLVQKRGSLMGAASGGGMAAVIGIKADQLRSILEEGGYDKIDIANYNTPTQIVLSGQKADIANIVDYISKKEVRVVPLNVSAPFHSRYMKPAAIQFSNFLENFEFRKLNTPVIANVTGRPYESGRVAQLLGRQIDHSVLWTDSVRYLMGQEVSEYEEMGRGILRRMVDEIRKICSPILEEKLLVTSNGQLTSNRVSSYNGGVGIAHKTTEKVDSQVISEKIKEVVQNSILPSPSSIASRLGSASFRKDYGVKYSYVTGAMYRGTASKELVISMGQARLLSFLGTAGMSLNQIRSDIDAIQSALNSGEPYGMNLIHHMNEPEAEMKTLALYIEKGVRNIEASAFMQMTESLVYYHAAGLSRDKDGQAIRAHNILAKVSRPEVAEAFMQPAPQKLLNKLINAGKITEDQADMAQGIPVSYDICVEADSGGHTDGGVAMVLLPSIQRLRKDISEKYHYEKAIRIGLAGGIGTPQSAACAFVMGADFILTGSINQCTVEAGTSDAVKDLLEGINVQDTAYAPAGDMFEIGAKVQVLRKGVLFPARANKLYQLYLQYSSIDEIPEKVKAQLERSYFQKPLSEVWEETVQHFERKGQIGEIKKAHKNSKFKMALIFRWYFGYSSRVAFNGDADHKVNFQIHTGPALGAFNQWVKGTRLESWRNRHVDEIGSKIMEETAVLLGDTLDALSKPPTPAR